jgi:tetratricopeptide (TPR) repeat protein
MHKNRGHFKKAEMVLRKSLEIAPENEYSLQTLGELLGEREQYDEAIEKFDKVLKLDPEHIETLVAWGELEAKRKNYPKAYELFARAKEINPQNIRVYGAWGEAKLKEGKLDEAEDLLYKAMLQDGDKIPAWNISGKLKAEQNDLDKAREFFRMSLRSLRDVKSLEKIITLNTWIEVELKYGDIEKAKWLLEKSLDLDGENNYTKEKAKRIRQKL